MAAEPPPEPASGVIIAAEDPVGGAEDSPKNTSVLWWQCDYCDATFDSFRDTQLHEKYQCSAACATFTDQSQSSGRMTSIS